MFNQLKGLITIVWPNNWCNDSMKCFVVEEIEHKNSLICGVFEQISKLNVIKLKTWYRYKLKKKTFSTMLSQSDGECML